MYPNVHSDAIYSNQDKEATQVSIIRQMDKEKVITHRHTMDCYSAIKRNEILPFVTTRMDLEIIILLSEVSQTKIYDITYM